MLILIAAAAAKQGELGAIPTPGQVADSVGTLLEYKEYGLIALAMLLLAVCWMVYMRTKGQIDLAAKIEEFGNTQWAIIREMGLQDRVRQSPRDERSESRDPHDSV